MNEKTLEEKLGADYFTYGSHPTASITVQLPIRILQELCQILEESDDRLTKHSLVGYLLDKGLKAADLSQFEQSH